MSARPNGPGRGTSCAHAEQAAAHHAREPRRRRARLAAGDARHPRAARQGLADVHVAGRVPAAVGVPAWSFDGLSARRPTTWPSARSSSSTAATSTACRWTSCSRRAPHPQHRPPPRQHALRHREPGRARGLVHRRDGVASSPRSWMPRSRRRSPRRSTSAWSPTPAGSCTRTRRRTRTGWPRS